MRIRTYLRLAVTVLFAIAMFGVYIPEALSARSDTAVYIGIAALVLSPVVVIWNGRLIYQRMKTWQEVKDIKRRLFS